MSDAQRGFVRDGSERATHEPRSRSPKAPASQPRIDPRHCLWSWSHSHQAENRSSSDTIAATRRSCSLCRVVAQSAFGFAPPSPTRPRRAQLCIGTVLTAMTRVPLVAPRPRPGSGHAKGLRMHGANQGRSRTSRQSRKAQMCVDTRSSTRSSRPDSSAITAPLAYPPRSVLPSPWRATHVTL